jgi:mono/diheme cytochrome c family protein
VDGGTKEDAGYLEDGGELATFTMIYNDIISVRCVSCHVPGGAGVSSGKLDMSTKALAYSNLVGASGMGIAAAGSQCGTSGLLRVTPNEHATSLLWQKVDAKLKGTAAPCGNPMPPGSPASTLSQAQVDDIADWIDSGALDD